MVNHHILYNLWNATVIQHFSIIEKLTHECLHQMFYCAKIINVNKRMKFTPYKLQIHCTYMCRHPPTSERESQKITVFKYTLKHLALHHLCRSKPIKIDLQCLQWWKSKEQTEKTLFQLAEACLNWIHTAYNNNNGFIGIDYCYWNNAFT